MASGDTLAGREASVRALGARGDVVGELAAYGTSLAEVAGRVGAPIPRGDEPHVAAWTEYAADAAAHGAIDALRERFVQLSCPIEAGISQSPDYRAATRQGHFERLTARGQVLGLLRPDAVTLSIVPTMAGRVPVVVAGERADFEALARALTARNEPEPVPPSMGACMVSGLTNWDRVRRHRQAWQASHPEAGEVEWAEEFRRLAADKALYQDRLVVLSRGPYSNVEPEPGEAGDWLGRSLVIRREHECAHYFTWRTFGVIRTHVFDELLADFVGLVGAYGRYPGALARRCLGLDEQGRRRGGRLENYRGSPPVSDAAFDVLSLVAARATANLERAWDADSVAAGDLDALARWSWALCHLPLEALASDDFDRRLAAAGRPPDGAVS